MSDEQTKTSFSMMVEKNAISTGITYLASLSEMIEKYGIEANSVNNYITRSLKEKIETESYELNLFKDSKPASLLDL